MKKLDYITIVVVALISVFSYILYFRYADLGSNNLEVVITYQNQEIDRYKYDESLNYHATFIADSGKLHYVLYSLDSTGEKNRVIKDREIKIKGDRHTENSVDLIYKDVHMHDADCPDRLCLRMKLNPYLSNAIVCTNGIVISLEGSGVKVITG